VPELYGQVEAVDAQPPLEPLRAMHGNLATVETDLSLGPALNLKTAISVTAPISQSRSAAAKRSSRGGGIARLCAQALPPAGPAAPLFKTCPATTRPEFLRTFHIWVSWLMHVGRVHGGAISDPVVEGTAWQGREQPCLEEQFGKWRSRDRWCVSRSHARRTSPSFPQRVWVYY
jgi:hypothetical protein